MDEGLERMEGLKERRNKAEENESMGEKREQNIGRREELQ